MVTAKLNREYALRLIGVGAMMVGICIWSVYDGTTAWPKVNKTMEAVRPALLATNLTVTAWLERGEDGKTELDALFARLGYSVPSKLVRKIDELKLPERLANDTASREMQAKQLTALFEAPVYSEQDIRTQWIQAVITLFLGLLAFGVIAFKATQQFIADDQGLSGSGIGPKPLAYKDITAIDWSKWKDKGIVRLTCADASVLTLDAWYFTGITQIVEEIQKHRPDLTEMTANNSRQE
jgi:hypothetical protein